METAKETKVPLYIDTLASALGVSRLKRLTSVLVQFYNVPEVRDRILEYVEREEDAKDKSMVIMRTIFDLIDKSAKGKTKYQPTTFCDNGDFDSFKRSHLCDLRAVVLSSLTTTNTDLTERFLLLLAGAVGNWLEPILQGKLGHFLFCLGEDEEDNRRNSKDKKRRPVVHVHHTAYGTHHFLLYVNRRAPGVQSTEQVLRSQMNCAEPLSDDNQYSCSMLSRYTDAWKADFLLSTPETLCAVMPRWGFNLETFEREFDTSVILCPEEAYFGVGASFPEYVQYFESISNEKGELPATLAGHLPLFHGEERKGLFRDLFDKVEKNNFNYYLSGITFADERRVGGCLFRYTRDDKAPHEWWLCGTSCPLRVSNPEAAMEIMRKKGYLVAMAIYCRRKQIPSLTSIIVSKVRRWCDENATFATKLFGDDAVHHIPREVVDLIRH